MCVYMWRRCRRHRGKCHCFDETNTLDLPTKTPGYTAGSDEKCYDWSSIFPTKRSGQCHLCKYSAEDSIEICENQSEDSVEPDHQDTTADSKDDFVHGPTPIDCCWIIGIIIFLVYLVKTHNDACEQQERDSRPVVCIPGHTLAARTAASSKSCWKGRGQYWAVARFRKALRKWRQDSMSVRQNRSNMILGGIFLLVLMFQPVAEGSAAVPLNAAVINTDDQQPNLDMSQLAQLDIDPVLLQFIGNVVTQLNDVKTVLHAVEHENIVLHNRTQVVEAKNAAVGAELKQLKRDKAAFENKTQLELMQERENITLLLIVVAQLQNRTRTNSVRLDQCEADAHPFIKEMQASHRHRLQEEETLCRGSGMIAMFSACCPSPGDGGGHRRFMQSVQGCDALPSTCSATCAPLFIEYFEGCQGIVDDLAPDQRQMFVIFYGGCQEVEQAAAAMLEDARPAMIFHVVVLNEAAARQAQMFGGGSAPAPIGPIGPLPPPTSPVGGAEIAQEFRRVCTTANLTVCVPQCNSLTYGFLLSIEIDGRGTVMTCNVMDGLYAWVGQASLGGYIGDVFAAFFSSVISGASGTYMVKMTADQNVRTDLTIEPGQVVVINGDQRLPRPPTWGSGRFIVGESASLSLSHMQVDTVIRMNEGASQLILDSCELTFTDTLTLRVATAVFLNQRFRCGLVVHGCSDARCQGNHPNDGATVTISDSELTFSSDVGRLDAQGGGRMALTVQVGAELTLRHTTLVTEGAQTVMLRVDEGAVAIVEACQLKRADGVIDPMPCDGTLPDCAGPHTGSVELTGVMVVRSDAPLVCDAAIGECLSDQCFIVDCGPTSTCNSPLGSCTCGQGYSGDRCETQTCCSECPYCTYFGGPSGYCCSGPAHHGCGPGGGGGWCDDHHPGWDSNCNRTC